ncbi:hypothetical protein RQP50_02140 [Paenibacillus sp. chi10]|uniref:Uncharacterized protein n=2 Tax=Paenibacillus TaxID=44249 RepID=A0AAJ2JVQ1_9BACL|nr:MULTISPECIES: hypothetical protein [Paenibacillus]EPY09407.1 hypothetical protein PAAL66ix_28445 [Paenibacillus alvei A6-6i-x]MCY9532533.1 hypothetical protein [Paenibacillus alvei]MDT8975039.1 hypothetical protein [Paenibacillus sp. chi10]SDE40003.1 hypothetical protein SAMN04488689_101352 [Paenibacillus sp. cl6col]GAV10309.1 hypothetical protein PBN151_0214 [Paenibacillus sp. NAIST15-1]
MEALQILIPVITALVTAIFTFVATRSTNRKDVTISDRKALSEDEKAFRLELKEIINSYKTDLEEAREEIRVLSEEVAQLHKTNLELTLENKRLQVKVDDLRVELQSFRGGQHEMD